MKQIILCLSGLLISLTAMSQATGAGSQEEFESRRAAKIQERDARHQSEIKYVDSLVLSRNYKFTPENFQQEPAGEMHNIYGIVYTFEMFSDNYMSIDLPYIAGAVPPYRMTVMNEMTKDIQKYTAVQDSDGWTITFSSNLYSDNTYTFTFKIYSITQECELNIVSDLYPTVTYNGTITPLNY